MNKLLIAIFALVTLMFSCKGNKTAGADDAPADSDSIQDTAAVDTMEQLISETPMPQAADELFDDFFFNFAANKKLQRKRIKFPLPVTRPGRTDSISKGGWKIDNFFMRQGYYTLIFDNAKQMDIVKDTSINHVVVEKINLRSSSVKQYEFNRERGEWMLTAIHHKPMYQNNNASFLKFYQKFASDTAFQARSLSNPVHFIGPDPDDDFSQMEGVLTPETWPAFAPELPSQMIYNIIYGQKYLESSQKIFVMRGIANGLEMELTFRKVKGRWILTKLSE